MKRIAVPVGRVNPSAGIASQTSELIVTSGTLLHVGGSPVAGRLKAKTLRVIGVSQLAATPLAMHAAGTPPIEELSAAVG
jgi:hypothetical protein